MLDLLGARPVTVKAGQTATIKIPFKGRPPPKVTWYKDGLEVMEDERTKVERAADSTTLVLSRWGAKDAVTHSFTVCGLYYSCLNMPKFPNIPAQSACLSRCVREDSGAIMLRLKSDCGTAVANLHLNVIGG